jgi:hypothetical protein
VVKKKKKKKKKKELSPALVRYDVFVGSFDDAILCRL